MAKVSLKGPTRSFFLNIFFNFGPSSSFTSFQNSFFVFTVSQGSKHFSACFFFLSLTTRLLSSVLFPCQHLYLLFIKKAAGRIIPLHPASPYSFGQFLCEKMSSVICTTLFEVLWREPFQFSCILLLGSQRETLIVFDRQAWLQVRTIGMLGGEIDFSHKNRDFYTPILNWFTTFFVRC